MTDQGRADAKFFLSRIRDHYVDQLRAFLAMQRRNSVRGESEVKLELEPGSPIFHSLSCADFVRNDGEPEIIDFTPERVLGFESISTSLGNAEVTIADLRWDDIVIRHDASFDSEQVLGGWFDKWFDPADSRYRPGAELGNVIHLLAVEPGKLSIDFGSAAPDAFWELLNVIQRAGATQLHVSNTPAEPAAS